MPCACVGALIRRATFCSRSVSAAIAVSAIAAMHAGLECDENSEPRPGAAIRPRPRKAGTLPAAAGLSAQVQIIRRDASGSCFDHQIADATDSLVLSVPHLWVREPLDQPLSTPAVTPTEESQTARPAGGDLMLKFLRFYIKQPIRGPAHARVRARREPVMRGAEKRFSNGSQRASLTCLTPY